MSKLFIVEGNQTRVLDQKAFDNETLLQDVVERFPKVIALEDLGVTEPFIVIGREVATKAGYIDVLCIESINENGDDFHPRFPGRTPSSARVALQHCPILLAGKSRKNSMSKA